MRTLRSPRSRCCAGLCRLRISRSRMTPAASDIYDRLCGTLCCKHQPGFCRARHIVMPVHLSAALLVDSLDAAPRSAIFSQPRPSILAGRQRTSLLPRQRESSRHSAFRPFNPSRTFRMQCSSYLQHEAARLFSTQHHTRRLTHSATLQHPRLPPH